MSASNDGSEDVDQFLARIASLSKKSGSEDAEQSRKMEEQRIQARKEREARRAERARSISPSKTGPAAIISPSPARPSSRDVLIDPPVTLLPHSRTQTPTTSRPSSPVRTPSVRPLSALSLGHSRELPQRPQEPQERTSFQSAGSTGLSRSGTLSWQQRPTSRGIGSGFGSVRSRPLSRDSGRQPPESPKESVPHQAEETPSRQDIAAALGSRDHSWFRQTQDRGIGSAAYRKSEQNEDATAMPPPQALRLPGMANSAGGTDPYSLPPERATDAPSTLRRHRTGSPTRNTASVYVSNEGPKQIQKEAEPLSESFGHVDHVGQRNTDGDLGEIASVLGGRPPSPTKGLGGFVQSAMMRRTDSVSKRWSVQANAGLKRGDSVAGNKPNFNQPVTPIPSLGHARTLSRDPRGSRDETSSPLGSSRPTSSHGPPGDDLSMMQKSQSAPQGPISLPSSRANTELPPLATSNQEVEPSLSRSPSKTLDPRRWSPTKASWLESALSKPESPRFSPAKEDLPPWKLDMQRSKSNKDLAEAAKKTIPHEPVSTPSLLRSPPPAVGTKPLDVVKKFAAPDVNRSTQPLEAADKVETASEERRSATPEPVAFGSTKLVRSPLKSPPASTINAADEPGLASDKSDLGKNASGFQASTDRRPPVHKPKPDTPPKPDFRASLKSRSTPAPKTSDEPEFRAVFGKLKKAQTQNYVAPDLLKDNITRGKAALAMTGGPQPRKRVDEFKESILAKKEEMKAGTGPVHRKADSRDASPNKAEAEVPEALRRRNTLHRSKASTDEKKAAEWKSDARSPPLVHATTKPSWSSAKTAQSTTASYNKNLTSTRPAVQDNFEERAKPVSQIDPPVAAKHQAASKPQVESRVDAVSVQGVTDTASIQKDNTKVSEPRPAVNAPKAAGRELPSPPVAAAMPEKKTAAAPTGIAARLNPALAGLIARGGSPKPQASATASPPTADNARTATEDPANLTHMTKGRAKGPKRKAPKATGSVSDDASRQGAGTLDSKQTGSAPVQDFVASSSGEIARRFAQQSNVASDQVDNRSASIKPISSTKPKPLPGVNKPQMQSEWSQPAESQSVSGSPAISRVSSLEPEKAKSPPPIVAAKSPELRRVSGQAQPPSREVDVTTPKPSPKKAFAIATDKPLREGTPGRSTPSTATVAAATSSPMPLTPSRNTLTSAKDAATAGLGLNLAKREKTIVPQELTRPPEKTFSPRSPPKQSSSKPPGGGPLERALAAHFSTIPSSTDKADFDTEAILSQKASIPEPIKTISKQIFEVASDGKHTPLPEEQQHLLFEDSLHLVVHTYETISTSKKSTTCHLWTGDAVPISTIEDVQLFCRKTAREHSSAKVEVVKQGKEPADFLAALGGIVVTRRSKQSSSALYMLCGRRHLGHIVFDEVDFAPSALCSGFPYLLSAKFGKMYFWKGAGASGDEVGAARLMGMDLALTGEFEEVVEGKEPPAFWESFPNVQAKSAKAQFQASDIWAMRSMDEKKGFPCRLYRLEAERPKSSGGGFWGLRSTSPSKESGKMTLTEIEQFVQADLDGAQEGRSVHVLDAWASIYVIPGSKCKPTDFVTALHIAQEMAVLTPSMQDRALLPSCEVVLAGCPPREVRAAFRKYTVGRGGVEGEGRVFEAAEVLSALD